MLLDTLDWKVKIGVPWRRALDLCRFAYIDLDCVSVLGADISEVLLPPAYP